jgi:hypothetical protein
MESSCESSTNLTLTLGKHEIRAPAIQRLGLNLIRFINNGTNKNIKEVCEKENIDFSTIVFPESYGILSEFPTCDVNRLSNTILQIIRCYSLAPEIHTKITMMYAIQKVGSIFISHDLETTTKMHSLNLRAKEVLKLSEFLFQISKIIKEQKVEANVTFIDVQFHDFHRDSQFISFEAFTA